MQAAHDHNEAMAQAIQISHRLPGERPLIAPGPDNDRYDAVSYGWTIGGENVAVGQDTPTEVMAAWMASTGHRNNILASVYRDVGLAYKLDAGHNPWWTQDFGTATDSPPAPSQNPRSTGVFRTTNGYLYMKHRNDSGIADMWLHYGIAGDKPVAGDWNGDTIDSIGIYRKGAFYLRNSNTAGNADAVFSLGIDGDDPFVGDWDGLP